jgi:hypothetical protein
MDDTIRSVQCRCTLQHTVLYHGSLRGIVPKGFMPHGPWDGRKRNPGEGIRTRLKNVILDF